MFPLGGRSYWYSVGSRWTWVASANPSQGIGFSGVGFSRGVAFMGVLPFGGVLPLLRRWFLRSCGVDCSSVADAMDGLSESRVQVVVKPVR